MITALLVAIAVTMQTPTVPPAVSTDPELEARTSEIASGLRCPVCQGLSIDDSPTDLAVQMKDVVRTQLREGKSRKDVEAYFVSKYGEWILLEPKATGANLLVYLLPIAMVLGGAVLILVMVRKWSRASAAGGASLVEEEEELQV